MKRVLLIDDDSITNLINKKLIENTGLAYEILVATSGKQGLDIIIACNGNSEPTPDIIILDINMPVMGGFEFLEALHHVETINVQQIKIIILSSPDSIEDLMKAQGLGVTNYFVKPMPADSLISLLI